MKPYKGNDQSYELNCSPMKQMRGGLRPPTCHYTSPHAIFVGITSKTQSVSGPLTLLCPYPKMKLEYLFGWALRGGSFPWCKMTLSIYIFQINITVFIFHMIVDHWIYFVFKVLLGQVLLVGESGL
jgi:hypothetical protein